MNWYAVWSATISLLVGILILAISDPWELGWRGAQAERLSLIHRVEKAESQAKYYSDIVIKCINKRWFSFEDHLIFCDPIHAPTMRK